MDGDLAETVQVLATVIDDGLPTIGIAEEGSALRGDVVAGGPSGHVTDDRRGFRVLY